MGEGVKCYYNFCVEFRKGWDFLVGIFHEARGYSLVVTLTGGAFQVVLQRISRIILHKDPMKRAV